MFSPFEFRGIKACKDCSTMRDKRVDEWEHGFRAAARADHSAILRAHMRRLGLPNKPRLLLEGTVRVVRMCATYAIMESQDKNLRLFLDRQRYRPSEAADARYIFTFDLFGKAFARVLATTKEPVLDLADLYNSTWMDYESVGFQHLWVSRPNWSKPTMKDVRYLENEVTSDLRFDYTEDELNFWFDDSLDESYLFVAVQDVSEVF